MNEILAVLPYATPLAFAALGEVVGERSGVINIGLEGMMLIAAYGALVGVTVGPAQWAVPVGFAVAILFALLFAIASALFTIRLKADQVVVGTAINLLAIGLTATLFRAKYGHSGRLLSLPTLTRFHGFDAVIVLLILTVPIVWFLTHRTGWGLAVRATGEFPRGSEAAGFSPSRLRFQAALIGGLFAGLGGAYLVLGTTGSFTENMTSGRGFVAIALVTFGRRNAFLVFGAALLIGYLDALQYQLQASGTAIPREFLLALPYLVALVVLVVVGKRGRLKEG